MDPSDTSESYWSICRESGTSFFLVFFRTVACSWFDVFVWSTAFSQWFLLDSWTNINFLDDAYVTFAIPDHTVWMLQFPKASQQQESKSSQRISRVATLSCWIFTKIPCIYKYFIITIGSAGLKKQQNISVCWNKIHTHRCLQSISFPAASLLALSFYLVLPARCRILSCETTFTRLYSRRFAANLTRSGGHNTFKQEYLLDRSLLCIQQCLQHSLWCAPQLLSVTIDDIMNKCLVMSLVLATSNYYVLRLTLDLQLPITSVNIWCTPLLH